MLRILVTVTGIGLSATSASAVTIIPSPSLDLAPPEVLVSVSLGAVSDFNRNGDAPQTINLENNIDGANGVQRSAGEARVSGGANPTAASEALTFVESFTGTGTFGAGAFVESSLAYTVGIEAPGLTGPFTVPVLVSGFVEASATAGAPTDVVFSGRNDAEATAYAEIRTGETNSALSSTLVFNDAGLNTSSEDVLAFASENGFDSTTRDPGERVEFEIQTEFQCVDGNDCSTLLILLQTSASGQSTIPAPVNGGPTSGDEFGTTARAIADPVFTITDPELARSVNILVNPNVLIEDPVVAVPLPPSILLLTGALGLLVAQRRGGSPGRARGAAHA